MSFDKDAWIRRACGEHGEYRVDRDGQVFKRRHLKGEALSLVPVKMSTHARSGRVYFNMRFEGITKSVLLNRVVALVHLPNPRGLPEVNHRFGDLTKNGADDLEWAGRGEQERHAFAHGLKANRGSANANARLTVDLVTLIRSSSDEPRAIARRLGVKVSTVRDVIARRTWDHI